MIGVLAETVQNINEALLAPYLQSLFTSAFASRSVSEQMTGSILVFYQYLLDEDEEVRTNSCFGMGVLCQAAQQQLLGQYETILSRLSQVLSKETDRRMIDNVCSCLCRMMVVSPKHVPLNQVGHNRCRSETECTHPSLGSARSLSTSTACRGSR